MKKGTILSPEQLLEQIAKVSFPNMKAIPVNDEDKNPKLVTCLEYKKENNKLTYIFDLAGNISAPTGYKPGIKEFHIDLELSITKTKAGFDLKLGGYENCYVHELYDSEGRKLAALQSKLPPTLVNHNIGYEYFLEAFNAIN